MRRYRAYVQPLMALLAVCILLITGGLYMLSNRLVSNSYAGRRGRKSANAFPLGSGCWLIIVRARLRWMSCARPSTPP